MLGRLILHLAYRYNHVGRGVVLAGHRRRYDPSETETRWFPILPWMLG